MLRTELVDIPRQAEIGSKYVSTYINEDVLGLEISMDDSVSMKLVEGNQDLCHEMRDYIEGQGTFWEPTLGDGESEICDVHFGDDAKGRRVIEGRDER